MNTKFNIHYSTTPTGPWTLSNPILLDRVEGLQTYTITGLNTDTVYYVSIVGGQLDSQGNFEPLISQTIGPNPVGAANQEIRPVKPIGVRTFSPKISDTNSLSMSFEVTI